MGETDEVAKILQHVQPFEIPGFRDGAPVVLGRCDASTLADLLAFEDPAELAVVAASWGRITAAAERVRDLAEHDLTVWKSRYRVDFEERLKVTGEKKPTEAAIEAGYRTDPEYDRLRRSIHNATEVASACFAVAECCRALSKLKEKETA